jgi:hypothetical protein
LKHYWIYYGFVKGQDILAMGQALIPLAMEFPLDRKRNVETLLQRLNEPDAFDLELHPSGKGSFGT